MKIVDTAVSAPFGATIAKARFENLETCFVPSGDSTPIGIGDWVQLAGSASGSTGLATYKTVARAATTGSIYGLCVGIASDYANSLPDFTKRYRPASTAQYIVVYVPTEGDLFYMQEDGDTTPLVANSVGSNVSLATVSDCNTTTGVSKMMLDSTTVNTTNTLRFLIRDLAPLQGNAVGGVGTVWAVSVNNRSTGNLATGLSN